MATNNALNNNLSGQSGSGAFAGSVSASLIAPYLGVASATSLSFSGTTPLSSYITSGTWLPEITLATTGDLSVTYAEQTGRYSRVGNMLLVYCKITFTPTYTTASGLFSIIGSPFVSGGGPLAGDIISTSTLSWVSRTAIAVSTLAAAPSFRVLVAFSGGSYGTISAPNYIPSGVQQTFEFTIRVRL